MQSSAVFVVLFFLIGACLECQANKPRRCDIQVRCSDIEEPVPATTDGKFCEVFRNDCILRSRNCSNLNENKPLYREISQEKCRKLCNEQVCLAVFDPVCGIYSDEYRTFGNSCEMSRYICTTQKTFVLYRAGECPK